MSAEHSKKGVFKIIQPLVNKTKEQIWPGSHTSSSLNLISEVSSL
jgi:hypothetical protein